MGTQNQPLEYEQAGYNSPDGVQIGRAAGDKVGFYGVAPVVRPTISGSVSSAACLSTIVTALANCGFVSNATSA